MKITSRWFLAGIVALSIGGTSFATVYADGEDSSATCDQITSILKKVRPGTLSYQRMKDQYNRKCLVIKSGCPSQAKMDTQSKDCTAAGMYSIPYIDPSSCRQIKCSATPPASSSSSSSVSSASSARSKNGPCPDGDTLTNIAVSCKKNNQKFEYYNINGCRQVRCIENVTSQGACPSVETMRNKASACKSLGHKYETFTVGVCKMVRCLNEALGNDAVICPDNATINAAGSRCTAKGQTPVVSADANGCRKVTCKATFSSASSSCPSDDQLDSGIRICKNSGMTGTTMQDENGCRQVICQTK